MKDQVVCGAFLFCPFFFVKIFQGTVVGVGTIKIGCSLPAGTPDENIGPLRILA